MTRAYRPDAHAHTIADAPRLPHRGEDWFTAAAGGRDAQRNGQPISANPFTTHRPDWKAWRLGWVAASRGEDVTTRYRLTPPPKQGRVTDYTADALADFRAYAKDESIAPDLREAAREILSLVEINARAGMRYSPRHSDELERRSNAQIEQAIERACARWPNATRNEIVVAVNTTDRRVRSSPAWNRHVAARAGQEKP